MSSGAELEMTWIPLDALSVMLSYSYLNTEVKSDVYILDLFDRQALSLESSFPDVKTAPATGQPARTAGGPANLDYYQNAKGGTLPSSPENKVNASVTYRWDFALGSLTPALNWSWRDEVSNSTGLLSRPTTRTPSYDTMDVRATWEDSKGRFSILGYVRNVFDDDTYNTTMATTFNGQIEQIYNLNPPRTWGVEFQYRMGSDIR
jgi:iron complex outermembrane receptor protein